MGNILYLITESNLYFRAGWSAVDMTRIGTDGSERSREAEAEGRRSGS